jgi:hypothetical protein
VELAASAIARHRAVVESFVEELLTLEQHCRVDRSAPDLEADKGSVVLTSM